MDINFFKAVGKSSLVLQYVEGQFPEKYLNSLGDDDYVCQPHILFEPT